MPQSKFTDLDLIAPIQESLREIGYKNPTPIQEQTIPLVLEGCDVLGIAQTGTGKTAAFCLPIINHLDLNNIQLQARRPRSLILTPTRELAIQIHQNLQAYGKNTSQKFSVIFGGVSQGKQVRELKHGADTLVATPGRLLDLIEQGLLFLDQVEIFVLDEADRMLDMGFMRDVKRILPLLPKERHNLFFSATMPSEIQKLANNILNNPRKVEVTPAATTVKMIDQSVMYVEKADKVALLIHLLKDQLDQKTLVFVEMKYVANRVAAKLESSGIPSAVIHGNKSQSARQKAILDFTNDKVRVMIATDIASRGIDIDGITHVINYELSNIAESYVHRIGRTARAGAKGSAVSLVTGDEKSFLSNIEKVTAQRIAVNKDHPYHSQVAQEAVVTKVGKAKAKLEKERKQELNEVFGQRKNRRSKPHSKKSSAQNNRNSNKKNQSSNKRKSSSMKRSR